MEINLKNAKAYSSTYVDSLMLNPHFDTYKKIFVKSQSSPCFSLFPVSYNDYYEASPVMTRSLIGRVFSLVIGLPLNVLYTVAIVAYDVAKLVLFTVPHTFAGNTYYARAQLYKVARDFQIGFGTILFTLGSNYYARYLMEKGAFHKACYDCFVYQNATLAKPSSEYDENEIKKNGGYYYQKIEGKWIGIDGKLSLSSFKNKSEEEQRRIYNELGFKSSDDYTDVVRFEEIQNVLSNCSQAVLNNVTLYDLQSNTALRNMLCLSEAEFLSSNLKDLFNCNCPSRSPIISESRKVQCRLVLRRRLIEQKKKTQVTDNSEKLETFTVQKFLMLIASDYSERFETSITGQKYLKMTAFVSKVEALLGDDDDLIEYMRSIFLNWRDLKLSDLTASSFRALVDDIQNEAMYDQKELKPALTTWINSFSAKELQKVLPKLSEMLVEVPGFPEALLSDFLEDDKFYELDVHNLLACTPLPKRYTLLGSLFYNGIDSEEVKKRAIRRLLQVDKKSILKCLEAGFFDAWTCGLLVIDKTLVQSLDLLSLSQKALRTLYNDFTFMFLKGELKPDIAEKVKKRLSSLENEDDFGNSTSIEDSSLKTLEPYLNILELPTTRRPTEQDISAAKRSLLRKNHPDKVLVGMLRSENETNEQFAERIETAGIRAVKKAQEITEACTEIQKALFANNVDETVSSQ